ncbi:glycosyltransferase family 4 protein [Patescibacteria group bacterium]|nr:glycosyltransferase family 4 protein [Patescibacteria group bacterium]
MTIAIDIRALLSSQLTGVGVYLYEILKQLFNLDQKNNYKLFLNSLSGPLPKIISEFKSYPNVKVYSFNYPNKLLNLSLIFVSRPALDKMIGGCDLFWFPNLNFWQVTKNCKTVISIHDLSFQRIPWAYSAKMRWWHKAVKPKVKLEQADKILTVSRNSKRDLQEVYDLPVEKIEVIYPGIEENPPFNQQNFEKKYKLPKEYILYLGTLEPRKNVEGVIQAFEKINKRDIYLIIAGGKGWLYRRIYKTVQKSKAKNRIIFLDYVNSNDRWQLYYGAKLLLWPSFYEGFGFPVVEAMSCGCPVITSANSSLPEVTEGAAFLVDPYNIQEITSAVNYLLNDEKLRQQLIAQGLRQAKKFNWQETAKKVLQTFESLK